MVNTKVVVLLIALSVVVALIAGIAFSQFASAQANTNGIGQTSQGPYGAYPQQGYSGSGQYGSPYGYSGGMGMGMCGRFW
jgi:hypothetical protein